MEFELNEEDAESHQLWVRSSRENAPYPLLGHENVFSIYLSHLRDTLPEGGSEFDLRRTKSLGEISGVRSEFSSPQLHR